MRFTRSIGHGIGRATMGAHQASGKRRQQGVSRNPPLEPAWIGHLQAPCPETLINKGLAGTSL